MNGELTIAASLSSDRLPPQGSLVARVFAAAGGLSRDVVVVAEGSKTSPLSLPVGVYAVQLLLPSGEVLQQVCELTEGSVAHVEFSPTQGTEQPTGRDRLEAMVSKLVPAGPVFRTRDGRFTIRRRDPQATLSRLQGVPPVPDLARLDAHGVGALEGEPCEWTTVSDGVATRVFGASGRGGPPGGWYRVQTRQAVELAFVPHPWFSRVSGDTPVQLMVSTTKGYESAASAITVADPYYGSLFAYLDRGYLGAARPLLKQIGPEQLISTAIQEKRSNPLAACAAAYAGLAILPPQEAVIWDEWLPNIMNWFPEIPDGAILHARRIELRPAPGERSQLEGLLHEAHRRGTPTFSVGFTLLSRLWRSLGRSPDEGSPMNDLIRLASRVDQSQTFTVLRFPHEHSDAP